MPRLLHHISARYQHEVLNKQFWGNHCGFKSLGSGNGFNKPLIYHCGLLFAVVLRMLTEAVPAGYAKVGRASGPSWLGRVRAFA